LVWWCRLSHRLSSALPAAGDLKFFHPTAFFSHLCFNPTERLLPFPPFSISGNDCLVTGEREES
jgi:hypothetical protein